MATDLARLVVSLEAQNTQMLMKLEQSERATASWRKKTESAVKGVATKFKTAFAGIAIGAGLTAGFRAVLKATAESEASIKQLETALKSTGGTVGFTSNQLQGFAKELMRASTFSDEAITDVETRLVRFTGVTGDVFKRATQAVLDLSAGMGKELPAAALQIGKALSDPIKGLNGLARAGVTFTAEQKSIVKALAETGHLAEAQGIILDRLSEKYGGAAFAARDTFAGSLKALGNAFGELLEGPSGPSAATDAINDFTKALEDPQTVAAANRMAAGVISAFAGIARSMSVVMFLFDEVNQAAGRVGADDLVRLNEELDKARDKVAREEVGGIFTSWTKQAQAAREEVVRLEKAVADGEARLLARQRSTTGGAPAGAAPVEKKSTAAANALMLIFMGCKSNCNRCGLSGQKR